MPCTCGYRCSNNDHSLYKQFLICVIILNFLLCRFYVPSLIKSVTFSYQDCIIQPLVNNTTDDLCPVDFRVRSNYLPGNKTKPVDCQSQTSCSFPFSQPEGNMWYYIRVDLSSSEVIGLNLSLGVDLMGK